MSITTLTSDSSGEIALDPGGGDELISALQSPDAETEKKIIDVATRALEDTNRKSRFNAKTYLSSARNYTDVVKAAVRHVLSKRPPLSDMDQMLEVFKKLYGRMLSGFQL